MTPDIFTIALDDGGSTTATRYRSSAPTSHPLVLAHGAGAGQQHPFIAGVARQLAERGVDVWTFNFPYTERQRRVPDAVPVLERCFCRVIERVRDVSAAEGPLVIGGKSMGGRIATHLAAHGERVGGVFALGYPLHPPGKPEQLRARHLADIAVPTLIVQGERDPFGTPSDLAPVIASMTAPVTLETVPGGDHSLGVRGRPAGELHAWLAALIAQWARACTGSP